MNKEAVQARNEKRLLELEKGFAELVKVLLVKLWEVYEPLGFYPLITDGNRTLEEQKELYAKGRTKPGPIVTWTLDSNHIGGRAVDIGFVDINSGNLDYSVDYSLLGKSVRSIPGLDWGFDLWGIDRPHVQYNPEEAALVAEPKGHWSDAAMRWMRYEGIITKEKDPNLPITWGEFAVVTQRMYNLLYKNLSND